MDKTCRAVNMALHRALQRLFDKFYPGEHVAVLDLKVVAHKKSADALWRDVKRRFPDKPVIIIPPKGTRPPHLPSVFTTRP